MKRWFPPPGLPDDLRDSTMCSTTLRNKANGNVVYAVGVSHMSLESREDVKRVVRWGRPEACLVELCWGRLGGLIHNNMNGKWKPEVLPDLTVEKVWEDRQTLLSPWFWLFGIEIARLEAILNTYEGAEQIAAIEAAQEFSTPKVYPVDIPVRVTLVKVATSLWFEIGPFRLAKDLWTSDIFNNVSPVFTELEVMSKKLDTLMEQPVVTDESYREMREVASKLVAWDGWEAALAAIETTRYLKGIVNPLLKERDTALAYVLHEVSSSHKRSVAVLGAAHISGVTEKFGHTTQQDFDAASAFPLQDFNVMLAQLFACSLITPAAAFYLGRKARSRGGDTWRYFKYARRGWVAASLCGTGYWVNKCYSKYTATQDFQRKMLAYRK